MTENTIAVLDADTSKHMWQVLRMQVNDQIALTDGKGSLAEGRIHNAERHKCSIAIEKVTLYPRRSNILHLCVGFTKNNSRNEWLIEKATELGVASIIPVVAARSDKTHIRDERWQKILQSAIIQSQQHYLPHLAEMTPLKTVLQQYKDIPQKLVAHCIEDANKRPFAEMLKPSPDTVLLIGPEGDFTQDEVNLCKQNGFAPVSLGMQRLRTETAAIAAVAYFNVVYDGKN